MDILNSFYLIQEKTSIIFPSKSKENGWIVKLSRDFIEYTPSLQRGQTQPVNILDMTLNNLMVRFQ